MQSSILQHSMEITLTSCHLQSIKGFGCRAQLRLGIVMVSLLTFHKVITISVAQPLMSNAGRVPYNFSLIHARVYLKRVPDRFQDKCT